MTALTALWLAASLFILLAYYGVVYKNLLHLNRPAEMPSALAGAARTADIYRGGFLGDAPDACRDRPPKLLIGVTGGAPGLARRTAIRKTWGHYGTRHDVAIAFVLGSGADYEAETYGDVVASRNGEGLRTVALMEFVTLRCPLARYVLKANDDVYVNVPAVLKIIDGIPEASRSVYGLLRTGVAPIRELQSPRFISKAQYNGTVLPNFLEGDAYLFPGALASELYVEALRTVYVPVENVFITGIVAKNIAISIVNQSEFNNSPTNLSQGFEFLNVAYAKASRVARQYQLWTKMNELCAEDDVFV